MLNLGLNTIVSIFIFTLNIILLSGLLIPQVPFTKYREKGVDIKLATDLVVGAIDNQYDVAIVVSSDTDFIPAIDWVRSRSKKVEYAGFSIPHPSDHKKDIKSTVAMIDRTDAPSRIILEKDIRRFVGTLPISTS